MADLDVRKLRVLRELDERGTVGAGRPACRPAPAAGGGRADQAFELLVRGDVELAQEPWIFGPDGACREIMLAACADRPARHVFAAVRQGSQAAPHLAAVLETLTEIVAVKSKEITVQES